MNSYTLSKVSVGIGVIAAVFASSASANFAQNGGFVKDGGFEDASVSSPWEQTSNAIPSAVSVLLDSIEAKEGDGSGLFNPSDDGASGSFRQFVTLANSKLYYLQYSVRLLPATPTGVPPSVTFSFGGKSFGDFEVFTDPNDPSDNGQSVTVQGEWTTFSTLIQTEALGGFAGGMLTFEFSGNANTEGSVDAVSLVCANDASYTDLACAGGGSNPIPEPGSLLLVGGALAALGVTRRRKLT